MVIVGYGDIGAHVGKIMKKGFGMKVTGVKRKPDWLFMPKEHKEYCDEIVGPEDYGRVVREADFVVGILPKLPDTDDFFSKESTFGKMKKGSVFINIGRGSTVNEDDLVEAVKSEHLGYAALDVYKEEPLGRYNEIWNMPNTFLTPHCADEDPECMVRAFDIVGQNIENFSEQTRLLNHCVKEWGY